MRGPRPRARAGKWLCALAVLLLWALGARAQSPSDLAPASLSELDRRLADVFARHRIPGASVVVLEDGEVAMSKGYGTSDVRTGRPVTAETLFRAGSISKSITSLAVMILVEEGKLSLDARLSALAPEIHFDNPWEDTDPVRLVHLLEHTSGFGDLRFRHFAMDGHDMPLSRAVEVDGPYRCRWRPGTFFAYDNAGPVIAAYVVEKVAGQSFADFTRSRIFEPLGMTSARWDAPPDATSMSRSYAQDGAREVAYADIPSKPAGALNATAEDLARVAKMLVARGAYAGGRMLAPGSVARLETPASSLAARAGLRVGYGLGEVATATPKAIWYGHGGSIDGFLAEFRYTPERRAAAVVMINAPSLPGLGDAMDAIVAYLGRTWPALPAVTPIALPPGALEQLAGTYLSTAFDQDWQPALDLKLPLRVTVDGDGLVIGGKRAVATSPSVFAEAGTATPRWVFADADEGRVLLSPLGAHRRVPARAAGLRVALWYGLTPLALVGTLVALPIWLVAGLRRKVSGWRAWSVRLLPALAVLSAPALVVTFVSAVGPLDPDPALGRVSPLSVAVFALSLLVPSLALAAFAALWRHGGSAGRSIRVLGWVNVATALAASAHFALHGWLGLRTWGLP